MFDISISLLMNVIILNNIPAMAVWPNLWTPGETFPSFVSFWVAVLGAARCEDRGGGDLGFLAGGHQGTSSLLGPLKILLKCPIGTVIVASATVCNTNDKHHLS